jgi:predicted phosphodiesterase
VGPFFVFECCDDVLRLAVVFVFAHTVACELGIAREKDVVMRIAVIADVHGNRIALDAVLAHIRVSSPDMIVNLGDLVSGPFDPHGSAEAQMALDCPTIAGNQERQLLEGGMGFSDAYARDRLGAAHMHWIAGLPKTLTLAGGEVFACHGSPAGGDLEYLLEDVRSGVPVLDSEAAIRQRLRGIGDARVVLCGHTHIPRIATVSGILVVNPGSVGMPAYRDVTPVAHVMEAGAPHARYATVEKGRWGWAAELRAVPYDFEAAAYQAEEAGRPAVAYSLRTGRLPSL